MLDEDMLNAMNRLRRFVGGPFNGMVEDDIWSEEIWSYGKSIVFAESVSTGCFLFVLRSGGVYLDTRPTDCVYLGQIGACKVSEEAAEAYFGALLATAPEIF